MIDHKPSAGALIACATKTERCVHVVPLLTDEEAVEE